MSDESTRVMTAGVPAAERTMVASSEFTDPSRTQLGGTVICPVCKSIASLMDIYCGECGFLLSSQVIETAEIPVEEPPAAELVELDNGRRHRLKSGVNTIGRQGTDILVNEGTVSRTHARINVEKDGIIVEDLGSSNGTKVGDIRIGANQPTTALPGTVLKFGSWQVRLEGNSPAERTVVLPSETEEILNVETTSSEGESVPIAILKVTEGQGEDIRLAAGKTTFGRRTDNNVVISGDPYISGKHAEFICSEDKVTIADAGSTNGTLLNGERLTPDQPQELEEGDEMKLGQTSYRFQRVQIPPAPEEDVESREHGDMDAETETW